MLDSLQLTFALAVLFVVNVVVDTNPQSSCTTHKQGPGLCVPILTCEPIVTMLSNSPRPLPVSIVQLVQSTHCGTFDDIHHVCCEENGVSTNRVDRVVPEAAAEPTTEKPIRSESNSLIHPSVEKSDADVQAGIAILEGLKCGRNNADRVANGEDANLSEFPWVALLVYTDGVDRFLSCGGSLITDRYVLTAAHCLVGTTKRLVSVRLGEHDLNSVIDCVGNGRKIKCAPEIQEIDVEEAVYHQNYSRRQISNDIGLIRLVSHAIFRSNVQPICLPITPSSKAADLTRMLIAGWGRIETGDKPNILQKAVILLKTNNVCQQAFRSIRITNKQLCAGGDWNNVDTCKGDSGGPMFFSARYRRGARLIQYGVVSAGSTQCGAGFPGIYVKVTSYLDWIAGNLSP